MWTFLEVDPPFWPLSAWRFKGGAEILLANSHHGVKPNNLQPHSQWQLLRWAHVQQGTTEKEGGHKGSCPDHTSGFQRSQTDPTVNNSVAVFQDLAVSQLCVKVGAQRWCCEATGGPPKGVGGWLRGALFCSPTLDLCVTTPTFSYWGFCSPRMHI